MHIMYLYFIMGMTNALNLLIVKCFSFQFVIINFSGKNITEIILSLSLLGEVAKIHF